MTNRPDTQRFNRKIALHTPRGFARHGLVAAIAAGTAMLPGCIVAIGNETDGVMVDGSPRRVRLTDTERHDLPMVTSVADLPTVRTRYAAQIASLSPATAVEDLQKVLPMARFVERREVAGVVTDAYSVALQERYRYKGESYGLEARDDMWFYFRNGLLVKQGAPHDWP